VKFSPAGETVAVSVSRGASDVRVAVTDRGPGIPDGIQAHLFDRFVRAESQSPRQRGTGLGLAICKSLIEGQGGQIGFETGQATTFFFELPELKD
jgi:signal transduction histidine kinase